MQLARHGNARAAAEARRAAAEKLLAEQRALHEKALREAKETQDKALADLRDTFKALSADALKQTHAGVSAAGRTRRSARFQETAKGDLAQRQEAIKGWSNRSSSSWRPTSSGCSKAKRRNPPRWAR